MDSELGFGLRASGFGKQSVASLTFSFLHRSKANYSECLSRSPKPVTCMLYSMSHGTTFPLRSLVGISAAGYRDRALYPPAPRHLLDFCHFVSGMDWRGGLYSGGGDSGRAVAARLVSGVSPAAAHTRVGAGDS